MVVLKIWSAARALTARRLCSDASKTHKKSGILSLRRFAPVLLLPLLAACAVDVAPSPTYPRPLPSGPAMCTMEYAPVCAERGNQQRTFGNSCQARANGFFVVNRGECRREPVRPRPPVTQPPQGCTREFDPVCAQRGNQTRTFSNSCEARSGGFRVVSRGECRREPPVTSTPSRPARACTREYAPVCARRGGDFRTFGNACMARADGYRVTNQGSCN